MQLDYKEICNHLYDAIYISDSKGKTIFVNDAYSKITGIEAHEVVGKYVKEGEGKLFTGSVTNEVLRTKNTVNSLGKSLRNGRDLLVTGVPVFDKNGEIKLVVVNNRDILTLKFFEDQFSSSSKKKAVILNELNYATNTLSFLDVKDYKSEYLNALLEMTKEISKTDLTVFITGEVGSGKRVLANTIFEESLRRDKPFFDVQCKHYQKEDLKKLLFGDKKSHHPGLFQVAKGGTIILEGVEALGSVAQNILAELIKTKKLDGENIDVRLIVTTKAGIKDTLKSNIITEKLYYQLKMLNIHLKPLRERRGDILVITSVLLDKYNRKYDKNVSFSNEIKDYLYNYNWPANIWELNNLIERVVVVNKNGDVGIEEVESILENNSDIESYLRVNISKEMHLKEAVELLERKIIKKTLKKYKTVTKSAQVLGITQPALWNKCKKLGIDTK